MARAVLCSRTKAGIGCSPLVLFRGLRARHEKPLRPPRSRCRPTRRCAFWVLFLGAAWQPRGGGFSNQRGHSSNSQTPEGVVKGSVSHGGNRPSRSGSWLRASHDPATIMLYARPPLLAVDRGAASCATTAARPRPRGGGDWKRRATSDMRVRSLPCKKGNEVEAVGP